MQVMKEVRDTAYDGQTIAKMLSVIVSQACCDS